MVLYIHIPFCKKKCLYCDFLSFPPENYEESYFDSLIKEIKEFSSTENINSVFFGGGTPTLPNEKYIYNILSTIYKKYKLSSECEITIESNPGTLTFEKLKTYRSIGINRLSIGLQSSNEKHLKTLGRIHSLKDFEINFEYARQAGFDNINTDIMFSLPHQSFEDFSEDIEYICNIDPEHISAYSLIVEEGTPFYDMPLDLPDEDTDRKMYSYCIDFLQEKGYHQYEISNFSKDNKECYHNKAYWKRENYKGFGLGAASLLEHKRLKNTENIKDYISGKYVKETQNLSKEEEMSEFMFLGLRMTRGINIMEFKSIFSVDIKDVFGLAIEKHVKCGLLKQEGNNIFLTRRGMDISNTVFVDMI